MKTNLNLRINFVLLLAMIFLVDCKSNQTAKGKDTVASTTLTTTTIVKQQSITQKPYLPKDSSELLDLVKRLYKWHATGKVNHDGFKAIKLDPADTLYKAIDLDENKKAIDELRATGLFAGSFLDEYRAVAVRMDKELRDGSSLWPEGELPTFNDDVDEWCNCQDTPVDDYWTIIKLKDLKIDNNGAHFKWTWGDDFLYDVGTRRDNDTWKISYLQGFDMKNYNWGWWKNHKDRIAR